MANENDSESAGPLEFEFVSSDEEDFYWENSSYDSDDSDEMSSNLDDTDIETLDDTSSTSNVSDEDSSDDKSP